MDAQRYLDTIKLKIATSAIVRQVDIVPERVSGDDGFFRARLALTNDDLLEVSAFVTVEQGQGQTVEYRHQWGLGLLSASNLTENDLDLVGRVMCSVVRVPLLQADVAVNRGGEHSGWCGVRLLGVPLTTLQHRCAIHLEEDAVQSQTLSMHCIALP